MTRCRPAQSGFTYLFVLMAIALIGMGLAAAGTLWSAQAQRDREADLLFIGDQYRRAIASYYTLDPAQPRLPQSIDDLLLDNRRPEIVRHLRRAWHDPFGGELTLIRDPVTQGIMGVFSTAPGHPFRQAGFAVANAGFGEASTYADWRFVYTPPPAAVQPASPASPAPASPPERPFSERQAHP